MMMHRLYRQYLCLPLLCSLVVWAVRIGEDGRPQHEVKQQQTPGLLESEQDKPPSKGAASTEDNAEEDDYEAPVDNNEEQGKDAEESKDEDGNVPGKDPPPVTKKPAFTTTPPAPTTTLPEPTTTSTTTRKEANPLEAEPEHENEINAPKVRKTPSIEEQFSQEILEAFKAAPKDGGKLLDKFHCPKNATNKYKSEDRYTDRAKSGYCDDARGMDGGVEGPIGARFKTRAVAAVMGMTKGTSVLDWGAGCGHELDLICHEVGVVGVAMDLVAGNAKWAKENLKYLKDFCAVEGSSLPFADETFDFVMCNGALHHISPEDQCKAVKDHIMRVLRPGGCAWFGFMGGESDPPSVKEHAWAAPDCLGDYSSLGPMFTKNEMDLFGTTEYNRASAYSLFVCKK